MPQTTTQTTPINRWNSLRRLITLLGAGLSLTAVGFAFAQTATRSYTVTSLNDVDDGVCSVSHCSLREAIKAANSDGAASYIFFSESLFTAPRKTIILSGPLPELVGNGPLQLLAPRAGVQISGNRLYQIFSVANGANVRMYGLTIKDGNAGNYNGGGIRNQGALLVERCTLTGNRASGGGAIANGSDLNGNTLTLLNSTLSGNGPCSRGGAIFNVRGRVVITSCTITYNMATGMGGGVASEGFYAISSNVRTEVQNSIIAGNLDMGRNFGSDVALTTGSDMTFVSNGYNLIGGSNGQGAFYKTGDITGMGDPALLTLADNGGPTQTHAFAGACLARNTGYATGLDQRGVARPQEGASDRGAYEANTPELAESLLVTTTTDEDDGTSNPAFGTGTSLREAINYANRDGRDSVITFSAAFSSWPRKTITLSGRRLTIDGNGSFTLNAPSVGLEISGNNQGQVFYISSGNVSMTRLTIRNGDATHIYDNSGGGIGNNGVLTLNRCVIMNNRAYEGGGISSTNKLFLYNCTISGNWAKDQGGGLYVNSGPAVLDSCTITNNSALVDRGGGVVVWIADTNTHVRNSIIAGNIGSDVSMWRGNTSGSTFVSDGYNLIGFGYAASSFNKIGDVIGNANPGLLALANNAGPTLTHKLLSSSPAFNTGSTLQTTDQRGALRPQRGAYDKGAFELMVGE